MKPLLVALVLLLTRSAGAVELPLGVSAEKPESGPFAEAGGVYLLPYAQPIPGTDVSIEMTPVPGGELLLGSPESEPGRNRDEGPLRRVVLPPCWVATTEITWAQYRPYMDLCAAFDQLNDRGVRPVTDDNEVDAVTAPSKLYDPSFTFAAGEDPQLPAVTMTPYAAKQFTKWLSLLTGVGYRLPTEAEWEHACRAGSATPYACAAASLDVHAWHAGNSGGVAHQVGTKKPNGWGLHDMHGNAREWVIDAYSEEGYTMLADKPLTRDAAICWPTDALAHRTLRGGSALLAPPACRSAARSAADLEALKLYDPNTPTSPWWLASEEAQDIGFRIVRPFPEMPNEQMARYWNADHPRTQSIADFRIDQEGRGERGIVDKELPTALAE